MGKNGLQFRECGEAIMKMFYNPGTITKAMRLSMPWVCLAFSDTHSECG